MRKKLLILTTTLMLSVTCLSQTNVFGAAEPTVLFTENKEFKYSGDVTKNSDGTTSLGDAFEGMAPGDTKTQTIKLKNSSNDTMDFYISEETLDVLEEANKSSGGAYTYDISVGDTQESSKSLINAVAGGYEDGTGSGSTKGLGEISDLNDYTFLYQLGKGQSTNVYVTLTLEGEGNDSTSAVDYSEATGKIAFNYRAYDVNHEVEYGEDTVNTSVVRRNITDPSSTTSSGITLSNLRTQLGKVKTSDVGVYGLVAALLIGAGIVIVAITKSRKTGDDDAE